MEASLVETHKIVNLARLTFYDSSKFRAESDRPLPPCVKIRCLRTDDEFHHHIPPVYRTCNLQAFVHDFVKDVFLGQVRDNVQNNIESATRGMYILIDQISIVLKKLWTFPKIKILSPGWVYSVSAKTCHIHPIYLMEHVHTITCWIIYILLNILILYSCLLGDGSGNSFIIVISLYSPYSMFPV